MNDEWLPSFAKITQRSEPTLEDDPLQLSTNALGLEDFKRFIEIQDCHCR
jgi:hypothetical protein